MSKQLPQAPNPLSPRQTLLWYVALIVTAVGAYFVMLEGGADFKEPFVICVYFVCVGMISWLLRKFIVSEIKDREG